MKQILIITLVLGISMSFMVPHIGKLNYENPPTYRIDLNVPPKHRWDNVVPEFEPFLRRFLNFLRVYNLSDEFFTKLGEFGEHNPIYEEHVLEIKGMARVYNEVTEKPEDFLWQKLFLLNFFFELDTAGLITNDQERKVTSMCSAIVAKMADGKVVHGRNWDLFPMWLFSRGTVLIKVYKGDKYVASFDTVAGAVVVWSGMNANGFSLTLNARGHMDTDVIENIIQKGYITPPYLVRDIIQDDTLDYEQVVEILKETNITESMYYVMAGIDKGIIIEKGVTDYNNILEIGPDTEEWYLVQTNYDLWEDPGIDDRKTPASKRLEKIGQENMDIDTLFEDVMVKYPTLNMGTVQTCSFFPDQQYNNMTVWYGTVDKYWQDKEISLEDEIVEKDPYFRDELEKEYPSFTQEQIFKMASKFAQYMGMEVQEIFV